MPLVDGKQLPQRFAELARQAERIDIAVAWVRPCEAIEALASSRADVRIVAGISNNFTNPTTLRRLNEFAKLRIVPDKPPRIFHPKYYCFRGEETVCWVGSANLTGGGFGGNVELVHEFIVKRDGDREWFESLWADLKPDPMPTIREYERRYVPPRRPPRTAHAGPEPTLPSLAEVETWSDFVEGLRACESYYRYHGREWTVLGETHSWLHTIRTGRELVRLDDWSNLTKRECYILRGIRETGDDEGDWGLLGGLPFGGAPFVFNPARMPGVGPIRQEIRRQIEPVLRASENIAEVAHAAVQAIRTMRHIERARNGIGHAAATRWLALARPDRLVSLNNESARALGEASGQPRNSKRLADCYAEFLKWLYGRPWFNEFEGRPPDDPLEREIWICRAALVDAFVYGA